MSLRFMLSLMYPDAPEITRQLRLHSLDILKREEERERERDNKDGKVFDATIFPNHFIIH